MKPIPQIPKPLPGKSKWTPIVKPLAQAMEASHDLGKNEQVAPSPEINEARARLRDLHAKFKAFRKDPPEDCKDAIWLLSLCKVLDETLDIYFEKVDKR